MYVLFVNIFILNAAVFLLSFSVFAGDVVGDCRKSAEVLEIEMGQFMNLLRRVVGDDKYPASSVTIFYKDGGYYIGEILGTKRNGLGEQTFSDGSRYNGLWANDHCEGKGVLVRGRNEWHGTWKNGEISGNVSINYENGDRYYGATKNFKRDGLGTYHFKAKDKIHFGMWENGDPNGWGLITYKTGSTYAGEFKDGKKHGSGWLKHYSGYESHEEWENGKRIKVQSHWKGIYSVLFFASAIIVAWKYKAIMSGFGYLRRYFAQNNPAENDNRPGNEGNDFGGHDSDDDDDDSGDSDNGGGGPNTGSGADRASDTTEPAAKKVDELLRKGSTGLFSGGGSPLSLAAASSRPVLPPSAEAAQSSPSGVGQNNDDDDTHVGPQESSRTSSLRQRQANPGRYHLSQRDSGEGSSMVSGGAAAAAESANMPILLTPHASRELDRLPERTPGTISSHLRSLAENHLRSGPRSVIRGTRFSVFAQEGPYGTRFYYAIFSGRILVLRIGNKKNQENDIRYLRGMTPNQLSEQQKDAEKLDD